MMNVEFRFADRVLLLTGANGGIGREVARLFDAAGASMVLADRDQAALEAFAETLSGPGRKIVRTLDAASATSNMDLVEATVQAFGGIDFVVPAAGIYLSRAFDRMTEDEWRQTLAINLDGVFHLLSKVVPHLRAGSAIVTLTSIAAHRGAYSNAHYAASKGALSALTRSLARELAPRTRINAVAPGVIETPMTTDLIAARGDATIAQTPLGRLGTPREIAGVIAFLCSDAAGFITGETVHANGGLHMA